MNLNRFPWIDNDQVLYGQLEACPNCTETRVRLVEPRSFDVVDGRTDRESSGSADVERVKKESTDDEYVSGVDMESPVDV